MDGQKMLSSIPAAFEAVGAGIEAACSCYSFTQGRDQRRHDRQKNSYFYDGTARLIPICAFLQYHEDDHHTAMLTRQIKYIFTPSP